MSDSHPDAPDHAIDPRHARGRRSEHLVRDFLLEQGLQCLHQNWRCRLGEIDLIMRERDAGVIVFVEVRYRASAERGSSLDTVGYRKRVRLCRTVRAWLQRHDQGDSPVRIDVVGVEPDKGTAHVASNGNGNGNGNGNIIVNREGQTLTWVVNAIEEDG